MSLALVAAAVAGDLLFDGVRLWDGTGAPARDGVDVLVRDDRIAAVGPDLPAPEGARVVDGSGATLLPGLIDAHVHVTHAPGAPYRAPSPERDRALVAAHLRAYVACGVTTVLDAAIAPEGLAMVREALATGAPSPRFLTLGTAVTPAGGYPGTMLPESVSEVATPEQVGPALDLVVSQGAVGVKTTVEPGNLAPIWPLYAPGVEDALREGAAARDLPVHVHAMTPAAYRRALARLRPAVFVHGLDRPHARTVAAVAASGATVVSTLSVLDMLRGAWLPERLDDPLVRLVVPPEERATAADPEVARAFARGMVATLLPHAPAKGLIAAVMARESTARGRMRRQARALRQLVAAGVPVAMGSDSGAWPLIPYGFHGPTSLREVELLGSAGLSPADALLAATRVPARMLGVDDRVGTVEVGKLADLVLVEGDPLEDLRALRHARLVVRAGEARTPVDWMRRP